MQIKQKGVLRLAGILQIAQKLEEIVYSIKKLLSNLVKKLLMLFMNERICAIQLCCFTFVLLININKTCQPHLFVNCIDSSIVPIGWLQI